MRAADVGEVELPHHAHARLLDAAARALEVLEVEHDHVAPVATVAVQISPGGGVWLYRRDDLQKAVPDRKDRVGQPERAHARVAEGLFEAERLLQLGREGLELARDEYRLAQTHSGSVLAGAHARGRQPASLTGRVLSWLMKGDSTYTGSPASSTSGKRLSVSSRRMRSSRRASAVPRQKCRPPAPKAWCSGLRRTSKRLGSA